MTPRKVRVFKWKPIKEREKIPCLVGIFHQWGVNYEELESGPGNFTTAIIELEDGTVKNVDCELIQFIDRISNSEKYDWPE